MDKKQLLSTIGFSSEFISKLEEYQNNVVEIKDTDFQYGQSERLFNDAASMSMKNVQDNTTTKLIIEYK